MYRQSLINFSAWILGSLLLVSGSSIASSPSSPGGDTDTFAVQQENDPGALFHDAELEETGHRDLDNAIRMYRRVIERAQPGDPWIAKSWLQIGRCYEKLGKTTEAQESYKNAAQFASETREAAQRALSDLGKKKTIIHQPDTRFLRYRAWRPMRPFLETEFYNTGGAFEYSQAQLLSMSGGFGSNIGTLNSDTSATAGLGVRAGIFFPANDYGTEFGWSVNYISGPSGTIRTLHQISSQSFESFSGNYDTRFVRILNEIQHRVPIRGGFEVRIRGGAGIVFANLKGSSTRSSTLINSPFSTPYSLVATTSDEMSWSTFTADISPSLAYVTDLFGLDVGLVYLWIPSKSASNDLVDFKWSPLGLRVGLEF